jgi:hypothetical protein
MVGDKVVPIRGGASEVEHPTSTVMRVAVRVPSGTALVTPAEARRRAFRQLTEAAVTAYDAAGHHRATGDEAGAALLMNAANQIMAEATTIGEELARL